MTDINDMTKGELRREIRKLRGLVSDIHKDCYITIDDWHGATDSETLGAYRGKGIVEMAEATMKIIDESRGL